MAESVRKENSMPFDLSWPLACIATSACVLGLLGVMHVALTLLTDQLQPSDPVLVDRIRTAPMNISPTARFGASVKGFNLSHSMAALLFGAVYLPLTISEPTLLEGSRYLQALGAITLAAFSVLAWRYWFAAPLSGLLLATALYAAGLVGLA
jgi:hypothetical protein